MNENSPKNEREKLEAKLTALLLGELPAHEEAALHRAMDEDPELAGLYERLKVTIEIVREGSRVERRGEESAEGRGPRVEGSEARGAELKLPLEKREKLLAHFKTVRPKEFAEAPRKRVLFDNRRNRLLEWAAVAAVAIILAAITVPNFVRSRSTSTKNTVLNNLRLLDGAKQTWALEANASVNAIPSPAQVAPYFGRGGTVETNFSPIAMPGVKYVVGKVGETPGIETSVSQARRWMGGQRIPENKVHNGQVQLSMGELMDQKFDQNPAPQVAMNSPWQTRFVRNITKSGPNEQSDSTFGVTQRGKGESQIAGQEASVSRKVIRAKGGEERPLSAQPLIPREVDQTATFGFNGQPPPKPEIFLPSGNEAAGNEQLALNNADLGRYKLDNSNDRFINGVNLSGATNWVGSLDLDGGTASAGALESSTASTVSGVTNYNIFADSFSPQINYRTVSRSDAGGGQNDLTINYTNLIAGTVRRAEAEIRADEAERLRQANRELELSDSKAPIPGDIPQMGEVFAGESVETNGQFYTGLSHDDVSGLRYLATNGVVTSQPIDGNGAVSAVTMSWNTFDGTTNAPTTISGRLVQNDGDLGLAGTNGLGDRFALQGETLADNWQTAKDAERTNGAFAWTTDTHNKAGNITLADGSVQQQTVSDARKQFQSSTNTLHNDFGLVEAQAAPAAPQPTPKTVIALSPEPLAGVPVAGDVTGGGSTGLPTRLPRPAAGGKQVEMAAAAKSEARPKVRPQMTPIANKPSDEAVNGTEVASVPTAPSQSAPVTTTPEATLQGEIVLHHRGEDQDVQDGKTLFQSGKLDEADAKLKEALARDPNNQSAIYYESLIKQNRAKEIVDARNISSMQSMVQLDKDSRDTRSNVPAREMFTRTFKIDPNTFYASLENAGKLSFNDHPSASTRNVPASQVRSHATDVTGRGLRYVSGLDPTSEIQAAVTNFFGGVGVNLAAPNSVFFNDRQGTLTVHTTADNLDVIEAALKTMGELKTNAPVVPQQPDTAPPKLALPPPTPQPEMLTRENMFSTFSMNVSDVSFKLAAASLEKGQMPEPASIRSEEFINAFDYRDPEAAPGVPVAFNYERALYPFAHNRELLRFSLKTAAAGRQAGRPLNVVLLLDNSGSMERADRVGIIQEALRVLAGQLQAQDTFSIVTFARTARLRVDGIPGNQAAAAAAEVGKFTPEGGTDLSDALDLAYETALHHYLPNGDNRVVLLTDGAANLGDVDSNSLKQKVETHRKQGIALDCFGIGWEGYNDDLLEVLTRDGDGRYGFINTPEEASTEFVSQIAGALHVAAADVKVQVEFNPDRVISYRQIGYAKHQLTKEQFRDNTVAAGQIAAQEAGNALYTIEVNPQGQGSIGTVRVRYKVPDTGEIREQSWDVPYTGTAVSLEQASMAMRLATTASAFSEWLATSPFAEEVTTDQLLNYLNGVPQVYGADTRPQKLEWMIRQAKSISGK